jgi:hypothetical protein
MRKNDLLTAQEVGEIVRMSSGWVYLNMPNRIQENGPKSKVRWKRQDVLDFIQSKADEARNGISIEDEEDIQWEGEIPKNEVVHLTVQNREVLMYRGALWVKAKFRIE